MNFLDPAFLRSSPNHFLFHMDVEEPSCVWQVKLMNGEQRTFIDASLADVRAHCVAWLNTLGTRCVSLLDTATGCELRDPDENWPVGSKIVLLRKRPGVTMNLIAVHNTQEIATLGIVLDAWGRYDWKREIRAAIIGGDTTVLRKLWSLMRPAIPGNVLGILKEILLSLHNEPLTRTQFYSLLKELPHCPCFRAPNRAHVKGLLFEVAFFFASEINCGQPEEFRAIMQLLLDTGLSINASGLNWNKRSVLHAVASKIHTEADLNRLHYLLQMGANPQLRDLWNKTPADIIREKLKNGSYCIYNDARFSNAQKPFSETALQLRAIKELDFASTNFM